MRITSPFALKLAGRLAGSLLWTVYRTVRQESHARSVDPFAATDDQVLYSLWHDSAVMATFGGKYQRTVALTSRHRDGTFVEHILKMVGVDSVRGSSGKTGGRAALEILRKAETHNIVITPDGPRGPRRTMSRGIIYLASKTGSGIVPTAFACSDAWEVKGNWTSLTIPKPFSKVVMLFDEPVFVPANVDDVETNWFLESVQQRMDKLQDLAIRQLRSPVSDPLQSAQTRSLPKAA